jgi:hypothetical protein
MMKQLVVVLVSGLVLAAAVPASAQQAKDNGKKKSDVPADARPPRGMCRIWIDGVPAAQQPAATDCQTAVKNRPANGRVIFGDEFTDSAKAKGAEKAKLPAAAKGFTDVKPPPVLPKRPPE